MKQLFSNNASTTLAAGISSTDTTILVVDGSKFPSPSSYEYTLCTLEQAGVIEIVCVIGRSGNTLTLGGLPGTGGAPAGRGQEGTTAVAFTGGAVIEGRITRGTLDKSSHGMASITDVIDLVSPRSSYNDSFVIGTQDPAGNPIMAVTQTATQWRFINYTLEQSLTATSGTTTSIAASSLVLTGVTGTKYLVQFTSGVLTGQVRVVTSNASNSISWTDAVSVPPTAGDTFEILQANSTIVPAVDLVPVNGSSNAVSSDGVFDALLGKADTGHNHSGVYDAAGTASTAMSSHTGGSDPHPQYVLESVIGANSGVASLDGGGQIPAAQIPAIAITEFLGTVVNQATMLALTGQKGDWCVRSDTGTNWVITGTNSTLLAGWTELVYPAAPVSTVAGRSGAVTLTSSDLTDVTAAGRNLLDDASASDQRATLGLGNAATLNVGTSSGSVVAGDDSRLSDARTPISHIHVATDIFDSTAIGRALLTSVDETAARNAIGVTSATQIACLAYSTVDQSITSGVWTKVTLGTIISNVGGKLISSRFTPGIAGTYQISGSVYGYSNTLPAGGAVAAIYKNGSLYLAGTSGMTGTSQVVNISVPVYLSSTDYIELWANVSGSSPLVKAGAAHETNFGAFLVSGGAPGPVGPTGPVGNPQFFSILYGGF